MDNIKYKRVNITSIITEGKPGELVDIHKNINAFCLENNIIFNISKCFYINNLHSELSRGNHSNTNAAEILICLDGSFEIKLHDGKKYDVFVLNKNDAIFINKNIWIEFYNFRECIILAFVHIKTSMDNETTVSCGGLSQDNKCKDSCYDFNEFLSMCK
jgi:hypothetical protein